jgi:hypothetical protein
MAKSITNKSTGRFIAIPFVVLKSQDYRNLSPYATRLLNIMLLQYNGNNNGDLSAPWSIAKTFGYRSKGTLAKSLKELMAAGLIVKTRTSLFQHPNNQCALYAVTWQAIHECPGKRLDLKATVKPLRQFSLEKTEHPVHQVGSVRPATCTGEKASDPHTGLSKTASDPPRVPESQFTEPTTCTPTNLPRDLGNEVV